MIEIEPQEPQLPQPTAPASIGVSLRGFQDAESAERFGNMIAETARFVSRVINLERLDGITVAFDYDDALAQLDRGFSPSRPLTRTRTEEIDGVAMTPSVMRNGIVKSHIVFHAPHVLPLEGAPESDEFRRALYLVAHECGHIDDLKHRDEAFPDTILRQQVTDGLDAILEPVAATLWEEYAACRVSAGFGEQMTTIYDQTFASVLAVAPHRANDAIRQYRLHGGINRVLTEAGGPICQPLKLSAYLLGHLDGLGIDFDTAPNARNALVGSPYAAYVDRLHRSLGDLWSRRNRWNSYAEFDILKTHVQEALAEGGLILKRLPSGHAHVTIPFTPTVT